MPVSLRRKGPCYSVRTPNGLKARCTSKRKAKKQRNLLNAIEHSDWRPTGRRGARR